MEQKKKVVLSLYEGLSSGETEAVALLLASDLEWWFHGPPGQEHMMRVLTGVEEVRPWRGFRFRPRRVEEVGKWVLAEGWERCDDDEAYWVHAWEVDEAAGVITQFREYFNTCVTVRELGEPAVGCAGGGVSPPGPTFWKSRNRVRRPLPSLVLSM
ncbi:hypothetical protein HPP92_024851 [Vanilla planifolia]|uniref:Wound-induced protein 1 n=1 Tax=Vanilla planifolia TaxID=51239 RepID=A0A835PES6_VANPL|nr:hypothetical protein HPP92_025115 [Vanilla planifolia]KAG0453547.1 hypothetical protein HPP92_024851 [Vanilla planifolia]